jgi:hypothetical protein
MAASTRSGRTSSVAGSTSANRGSAPAYSTQFAVAAKVIGVVIASSPGPRPAATAAPWSAAVPELNATAWRAPVNAASASSKAGTRGPVVSQSDRSAAATAAMSSSEID